MGTPIASHVLIVEDDPELQAALAELIRAAGFSVQMASNGAEAITHFERGDRPCAVLVDLRMPGIVGQEVLEYLRGDEQLSSIPVAIVSASPELAPEGYPVFRKPLELAQVVDFVRAGCAVSYEPPQDLAGPVRRRSGA